MKKIITLIMIGSIIMTSCEKQPDVASYLQDMEIWY